MIQDAEVGEDAEEIVFHEIGIASRNQWQYLGSGVGHIGRGIEPVLEKEKQAENEARSLALREEIYGQQKWDQPLQQRPSPETQRGSEPAEQIQELGELFTLEPTQRRTVDAVYPAPDCQARE